MSRCKATLDGDVLALHPPELMHALPEGGLLDYGCRGRESRSEYPEAPDMPCWLRGGHERRPEKPEGEHEPDGAEPHSGVLQNTRERSPGVSRGVHPALTQDTPPPIFGQLV